MFVIVKYGMYVFNCLIVVLGKRSNQHFTAFVGEHFGSSILIVLASAHSLSDHTKMARMLVFT